MIEETAFKEKSYENFQIGLELWLGTASLRGVQSWSRCHGKCSHNLTFLKKDNAEGSRSDTSPFMKSQVMASVPVIT